MAEMSSAGQPGSQALGLIVSDPGVMLGKPVVRGTRLTVELLLEKLGEGWTVADLLDAYPQLTETSIRAALTFASRALGAEAIYPLPQPPGPTTGAAQASG